MAQLKTGMTLRDLLAAHPDWADLPIVITREDGEMDYVGLVELGYLGAGDVSTTVSSTGEPVLAFTPN